MPATTVNDPTLARFLRSRREALSPADVGLPSGKRRRVTGLRREEVAMLAGISTQYYLRLEQGRDRFPSEQVLDGIARALLLGEEATNYMRSLARQPPSRIPLSRSVDSRVVSLINSWPMTAAQVLDGSLTVLAANQLARALSPTYTPGANALRSLFLEPEMRDFYREWPMVAAWAARFVRTLMGNKPDPELVELVGELTARCADFRDLWLRHDVKWATSGPLLINHARSGPLDLHFQHLLLPTSGHLLVLSWAEPASPSENRLRALAEGPPVTS